MVPLARDNIPGLTTVDGERRGRVASVQGFEQPNHLLDRSPAHYQKSGLGLGIGVRTCLVVEIQSHNGIGDRVKL